ncbi:Tol-Pal system protein TolB [Thermoflexales bacterium]|nr:Tol-Pal system protein TolB [Thermoflexales bacterium]
MGQNSFFSSNKADGNWDIYTVTLSGGVWARLTTDPAVDRFPPYSPDGHSVAFRSERDGNSEIYVMRTNGGDQLRITRDAEYDGYPVFTLDGSGIVFASIRSNQPTVNRVNLVGVGLKGLMQRSGWGMATPRLAPSGHWLVYAGGSTDQPFDIYRQKFISPLQEVGLQEAVNLAQSCEWDAGVLAYGWTHAWQSTGEPEYYHWTRQWIDGCIKDQTKHYAR